MFGGLLGGEGSVKSSGSSSHLVSVIEIILENSAICVFITSCRLEFSLFTYVFAVVIMSSLWFAISSLKSTVSSAFSSLFNSVLSSSLSTWMSSLSALVFIFWLLGAFWMASMVLTSAELISQKPNCFFCSSEGGSVPSKLFGCGVKVT